ncbi:hypothetical protein MBANPS3_009171 [Mucor bainieri]
MATLPLELQFLIINCIKKPANLGKCRLVCKAWSSVAEVAMLTAQHLTIVAPRSTDRNGKAFIQLIGLVITPTIEIYIDGIVGLDIIYKKLIDLVEESKHPIAKVKMLPIPMNYNQTYMNAVLAFKHTLQKLILNFDNIPISWNLIYRLNEIERLTSLTLAGDTYNITLTDTILKQCLQLEELDIDVRFSDPIVLDKSSVHDWSSRNNVKKVYCMRVLRFGSLVRSDLLEYLIYKFPRIQTVQLTTNDVRTTEWLLFKNKGFVRNLLRTCPTCNIHCYKHKSEDAARIINSFAESHRTVSVKMTNNARKIFIQASL